MPTSESTKPVPGTEYVVLAWTSADSWIEVSRISASSTAAAVKKHITKAGPDAGTRFVAIPARSWQPVELKTTTVTTTKLEAIS